MSEVLLAARLRLLFEHIVRPVCNKASREKRQRSKNDHGKRDGWEIESMNPSVTATVTTHPKSCENQRTRPSENTSASAVMRLIDISRRDANRHTTPGDAVSFSNT